MGTVAEQIRTSKASIGEVLGNPPMRRLFLALTGSVLGDWAYSLATAVYVYERGGPTAVGVLGVVRYLSIAIVAPFASTLADRYDRRHVMIGADLVRFVLVTAAALLIWSDSPELPVYVLSVAAAIAGTAFRPAERAFIPSLARHPGELTAANVVSSTVENVAMFAGPALAGGLLAVTDVEIVFVFNALTFLWSAFLVARIRAVSDGVVAGAAEEGTTVVAPGEAADAPEELAVVGAGAMDTVAPLAVADPHAADGAPCDDVDDGEGFLASAAIGFRTIFASRDLRTLVALYCAQTVVAGASLVFSVSIAFDLLDLDKAGLGVLEAMVGVGGLVGGFVALVLAQRERMATDFGVGVIGWAAPLLLVAAVPELGAALVMMALIGLANSVVDVNALTIVQRLVPEERMGRVFGAMESALIAAMAIGSLLMPALISWIGIRWGLTVIGGTVSALALVTIPALRRIDLVALAPANLGTVRAVPILAVLPASVQERLARTSATVRVPAGDVVFSEGDVGDRFYIIEDGSADVTIRGAHIRTIGAGGAFGEIALLRDLPRTATVTATTDLVLTAIEREPFVTAVTGHGDSSAEAERVVTTLLQYR